MYRENLTGTCIVAGKPDSRVGREYLTAEWVLGR
jgi:hypothetical protein